jgi:hypothetical protein
VNSTRWLSSIVFVLALFPSAASADEPSLSQQVEAKVQDGIVKPLVAQDNANARFSRVRLPPRERRVRVLSTTESVDKAGRTFVAFAIDARFGTDAWHENDIVGCAYTKTGDLFVKRGDSYRKASFLFGKASDPVAGVCEAEPPKPTT